ncbi:fibronectin type III domain-containing protein [Paenibacillus chartarius]|uniref:Fibronectin type III domain-containing protein n=1 Tax=Paenibacillus chartarius TaxID=747481 RepID=A0ABV6DEG9_9BACL
MKSRWLRRQWSIWFTFVLLLQTAAVPPAAIAAEAVLPQAVPGEALSASAGEELPDWAKAEIEELLRQGLIEPAAGQAAFRPNMALTRGDAALWLLHLAEAAGKTVVKADSAVFTDLLEHPRKEELARASRLGLIEGYADGTFRPGLTVTRSELAVMLQRVLSLDTGGQLDFQDRTEVPDWAASAVAAMSRAQVIQGYEDNTYRPSNNVTRAEAAVMLHRSLKKLDERKPAQEKKEGVLQLRVTTPDAKPLAGASVQIHAKGKRSYAAAGTTDANGRFETKLPYGAYDINAVADGVVAYQQVEFNKNSTNADIRTTQAATITGKVTGNGGKEESGVILTLTTNPTFYAVTGLDGTFKAQVLPERTYRLTMIELDDSVSAGSGKETNAKLLENGEVRAVLAALDEGNGISNSSSNSNSNGNSNSNSNSNGNGNSGSGNGKPDCSCRIIDIKETVQAPAAGRLAAMGELSVLDGKVNHSPGGGGGGGGGSQTPGDTTPPSVPAGLQAAAGDSEASLGWTANADADLSGYKVYVSEDQGTSWRSGIDVGKVTSFKLQGLTNGVSYRVAITAYDHVGNESARSPAVDVTPSAAPDQTPPDVPANLAAEAGDQAVTLTWDEVTSSDLAGYNIYLSTDGGASWTTAAEGIAATTYVVVNLTNGTEYTFAVTAYDEAGNESAKSTSVSAQPQGDTGPDTTPPAVPAGFTGSTSANQADLTWQANTENDLAGYNLYVSLDGTTWTPTPIQIEPQLTAYSVSGLQYETTYWFALAAYDASGNESAKSAGVELTPHEEPDTVPPAAPTGLTAAPGNTTAQLNWNANTEGDLADYKVYVSANGGTTWNAGISVGTARSYQATGLTNGQAYTFAVTAIDTSGNESPKSASANATPSSGDVTPPSTPAGLTGSAVDGSAALIWNANEDSDLAGYKVYTSTDGGTTWNAGANANKLTAYTAGGLTDGSSYSFAVSAYDTNGNESGKSNVVTLTPQKQAIPADPAASAPEIPITGQTSFGEQTEFLYTGPEAVQAGVIPGAIRPAVSAVLRGKVLDADGQPLAGAKVTILNHPEFGQTLSRSDGAYDMVVNGTGMLTVQFGKEGYMTVQRSEQVKLEGYTAIEDVVLRPYDTKMTVLNLTDAQEMQVAQGTTVSDEDGARTSTLLVPKGTSATMKLPDGTVRPLPEIHFRATEYTVGANGKEAMPGELPQNVGYTYAVELSADEAIAAGATEVTFNQPLYHYVDNFLEFPVGTAVPNAYYDRKAGMWIPALDGVVIGIVSVDGGTAQIDTDGDGTADDAAKLGVYGITAEEQQKLATLYTAGKSLWRVPIPHFTPWDHNWPYAPPPDAVSPPRWAPKNTQPDPREEPCKQKGSIIGCEDQSLGEEIPIPGTPYKLTYQSSRTPGYTSRSTVEVPVTGASLPASLKSITVSVEVAGKMVYRTLPKTLNQTFTFSWDGLDGFGRKLIGDHRYRISVQYHYKAQYVGTGSGFQSSWAQVPTDFTSIIGNRESEEISLGQDYEGVISSPVNPYEEVGIAGWSFHTHHMFDGTTSKLVRGDGETVRKVSGQFSPLTPQGSGPSTQYTINTNLFAFVGSDKYFLMTNQLNPRELVVVRVTPDNIALKYAVYPNPTVSEPKGFAISPDGTVYLTFLGEGILKKGPADSDWQRVVGKGNYGGPKIPDGSKGTDVGLFEATALTADADGNLYFESTHALTWPNSEIVYYRLDARGYVYVAGGNSFGPDSGPATSANIGYGRMVVSPNGTLYIVDNVYDYWGGKSRVRRVTKQGTTELVAGDASMSTRNPDIVDGMEATKARFNVRNVFIDAQENVYLLIWAGSGWGDIYKITQDGIAHLVDQTEAFDFVKRRNFPTSNIKPVGVDPQGQVIFRALDNFKPLFFHVGPDSDQSILPEDDGLTLNRIDLETGRHNETVHAVTGAVMERFGYDAEGRLITLTDASGNVTTVERDAEGKPTAIVAPGGQRTTLTVDEHNQLRAVAGAGQFRYDMTYDGKGLLKSVTDPNRHVSEYSYDAKGLLIEAKTPTGGLKTIARTELSDGVSVTFTDAAGRQTVYETRKVGSDTIRTVTEPGGAKSIVVYKSDGSKEITYTDGTKITQKFLSDPRFGMDAPVLTQMKITTPDGRIVNHTENREVVKDAEGKLQSLTVTYTTNGAVSKIKYDAAARTYTETTAEGTVKVSTIDTLGRVVREEYPNEPIEPVIYTFDERGRIGGMAQGDHSMTYRYNTLNQLIAEEDENGNKKEYTYNDDGLLRTIKLPDGKTYTKDTDGNGQVVKLTMPDGTVYDQQFNSLNQFQGFGPEGQQPWLMLTHDNAGMLDHTTLASGRVLQYGYETDGARRITSMNDDDVQRSFGYSDATDRVAQIAAAQAGRPTLSQSIGYTYAGTEVKKMTLAGAVNATFDYTFDTAKNVTNITNVHTTVSGLVYGQQTTQVHDTAIGWDRDEQLTRFGPFQFEREKTGLIDTVTDGKFTIDNEYDELGKIKRRDYLWNGQLVTSSEYTYNSRGLLENETVTASSGASNQAHYEYDLAGQLESAVRTGTEGSHSESYVYDDNKNRKSRQIGGGAAVASSYTAQGVLQSVGGTPYEFDADGFLQKRGEDTFRYGIRGELLEATVTGLSYGGSVTSATYRYAYDAIGRRTAREDGSGITEKYLYGHPEFIHMITASIDKNGVMTNYYYNDEGLLVGFERDGQRYYVVTDNVGTPREVLDSNGTVVKKLRYDSYGVLLSDSNPSFELIIGFAGGLEDRAIGLVRFGARDYDPASGRWTARDPLLLESGEPNVYAYVGNNPVVLRDPCGLFCIGASAYAGPGIGGKVCITSEGISSCLEAGFGAGGGLEVDPFEDLAKSGSTFEAAAKVQYGPLKGELGGKYFKAFDPCQEGEGKLIAKLGAGPIQLDLTDLSKSAVKGKEADLGKTMKELFKPSVKLEAAVKVKQCLQAKW